MPSGRDPNQTFVVESPRSAKRGVFGPLFVVGLIVVGCGLLIAWGLNAFLPKTDTKKPGEVASATPEPTSPPAPAETPSVASSAPSASTPSAVAAATPAPVPTATPAVAAAALPPPGAGTGAAPPETETSRPDLRADYPAPTRPPVASADPTPPGDVFRRAVPPDAPPPTVAAETPPNSLRAEPTAPATPRGPQAAIDLNPSNPENAVIKEEVLKRIDLMPDLSPENREKLYLRVERTPGMGRVATTYFEIGDTRLRNSDVMRLREDLETGPARKLLDDPTVVFVVLGYADPTGPAEANKQISQARANAAVNAMRRQLNLANAMHAVAMGSSTLFGGGREQYQKNRVVEIWAVLP